jgi:hypothetical protein
MRMFGLAEIPTGGSSTSEIEESVKAAWLIQPS